MSILALRVAQTYEEIELDPGGMVVLSTDVNATIEKASIANWAKGITQTLFNRFLRLRKVNRELMESLTKQGIDVGWSVGNLFHGRYHNPKTGEDYNEKSFAIDIRGVSFDFVREVAKKLIDKFHQHSVLVVDYSTNRPRLIIRTS